MYIETPEQYYRIPNWGVGYFRVNKEGELCVHPYKTSDIYINLYEFISNKTSNGTTLPYLIQFPQILENSIRKISTAFMSAKKEFQYSGSYTPIFPIKVNQNKNVVNTILSKGNNFGIGLEVGTKTELAASLCIANNLTTIVCNGYKDKDYIKLITKASTVCNQIFVVIEKISELFLLKEALNESLNSKNLYIGIRARLNTRGSGKWKESGGDFAKFGLTAAEIVEAIDYLKKSKILNITKMLHVHIGSQITNTTKIKDMVYETGFLYAEMKKLGVPLEIIDFGGGLAVDYDGSRSSAASSSNYTVTTYANNLVFHLCEVCNKNKVAQPDIFTESGRAFTAYHSMIIINAFDKTSVYSDSTFNNKHYINDNIYNNELLKDLKYTLDAINGKNIHEYFQDAIHYKEQIHTLFKMGMLTLLEKAAGEQVFWAIVKKAASLIRNFDERPEGLEDLEKMLASKYICNFSIFNSIPDAWAIKQLFPISPIHRLDEMPQETATLTDITCDSDGKIERFVDVSNVRNSIKLHRPNGKPYYLGIFLTGAYQKVLGNNHNLLNSPEEFQIEVNGKNKYSIVSQNHADTIEKTLTQIGYDTKTLRENFGNTEELKELLNSSTYLKRDFMLNKNEHSQEKIVVFVIKDIECDRCLDELKYLLDDFPTVKEYHINQSDLKIQITLSDNNWQGLLQIMKVNGFDADISNE